MTAYLATAVMADGSARQATIWAETWCAAQRRALQLFSNAEALEVLGPRS